MNIGIFGGTFNPPHKGHINIAEIACKALNLDKLIIIPTKNPPHKAVDSEVPDSDRLNMTKLAFRKIQIVSFSDIELKRNGISYTADTLSEFKKIYANDDFYLIIGSDMYLSFEKWHDYKNILKMCKLAVFLRLAEDYDKINNYSKIIPATIIENEPIEISSSQIRENKLFDYVPSDVKEYIIKHKLYKD